MLRGCHPFSLELALNHHQGTRTSEANHYKKQYPKEKIAADTATSDLEISLDNEDDAADREIDLSLKPDSNRSRPNSSDEDKMLSSPDQDNSIGSNETTEKFKGKSRKTFLKIRFKKMINNNLSFIYQDVKDCYPLQVPMFALVSPIKCFCCRLRVVQGWM